MFRLGHTDVEDIREEILVVNWPNKSGNIDLRKMGQTRE